MVFVLPYLGLLITLGAAPLQPAPYDLVIHGGRILDGSGNPWFRADLGIRDGRIARIGSIDPREARAAIDATAKVVAPGFIDIHTHSELALLYWADVVVFDPSTVRDLATFEKPKQYPAGIEHVLVNGVPVLRDGEHTGAKPGKAVRGAAYVKTP
jgi:N-acyl-D-aspartate/D-glutamate deacylase